MLIHWNAPEKQLRLQSIQTSETAIILRLQLTKTHAFCPSCGTRSKHLYSYYHRLLHDLFSPTQHISIHLRSRKWFCHEFFQPQRIFRERFSWLKPSARQTVCLQGYFRDPLFDELLIGRKSSLLLFSFISNDMLLRMIRFTTISLPFTITIGRITFSPAKDSTLAH